MSLAHPMAEWPFTVCELPFHTAGRGITGHVFHSHATGGVEGVETQQETFGGGSENTERGFLYVKED